MNNSGIRESRILPPHFPGFSRYVAGRCKLSIIGKRKIV